jgi:hypothetical protein
MRRPGKLLSIATAIVLACGVLPVLADTITGGGTGASGTIATASGNVTLTSGTSGLGWFYLTATNTPADTLNGCNASGGVPATLTFSVVPAGAVTFASPTATIAGCDNPTTAATREGAIAIAFNVVAPSGTATVTATGSGGRTTPGGVSGTFTSGSFTVQIQPADSLAPTVSATKTPSSVWSNVDPVVVDISATDETLLNRIVYSVDGGPDVSVLAAPGAKSLTTSVPVSNNGVHTVTYRAVDGANNSSGSQSLTVSIDTQVPTLAGSVETAVDGTDPSGRDWFQGPVSVNWTAADQPGLSGIATAPADEVVDGEGVGLSTQPRTATDNAGNSSPATAVGSINIDKHNPIIEVTLPPDVNGWYNEAVTASFVCSDDVPSAAAQSGVANCEAPHAFLNEGVGQTFTATALDYSGRTESVVVGPIRIDATAPVTTSSLGCAGKNGYCKSQASVTLTATDADLADGAAGSGISEIKYRIGSNGAFHTYNGAIAVPLNSANGRATVSYYAIDAAGNVEEPRSVAITYDTIAPDVIIDHNAAPNAAGWNNSPVTETYSATDVTDSAGLEGSGVQSLTVDGATTTRPDSDAGNQMPLLDSRAFTAETAGTDTTASAEDFAGNASGDVTDTIRIDMTDPSVVVASRLPAANSAGWNNGPVNVTFACADLGPVQSGVADCTGGSAGFEVVAEGAGQFVSGIATDRAGNTSAAVVESGINIDLTPPTAPVVNLSGSYQVGAVPASSCTTSDALSGVASCVVAVTPPSTAPVGLFTYVATATDVAGNVSQTLGSYRVIYRFDGFLQPINDTAHQVGVATSIFKGGSTVPVKFQLKAADGSPVPSASAPKWLSPVKGSSVSAPVDESVYALPSTTGNTFRWDATAQQYIYNWGTAKNQTGFYWRIGVQLDDGQTYWVNIGLR